MAWTLEDVVREIPGVPVEQWKIPGQTAIPSGRYEVVIAPSNRFQRQMPRLLNVPGFEGVLIHAGNTVADTEGCLLVGRRRAVNTVLESRLAFADLFDRIDRGTKGARCWIEISNYTEQAA